MAISENIEVNAGEAIASVDDLAKAFTDLADKAAASLAKIDSALGSLGGGGAAAGGPDKLVAAWDKAAASIQGSVDKITASMGKLDDLGAGAAGAADKLSTVGDAGKAASSGVDALGTSATGAADKLKGLGDSATGAGDGLKGVGDSAKASEAFLAEYNATLAETAAMSREAAAASADASAKIAASQRLNTAAMKAASDEAVAAQAEQSRAAKQAAADAEAAQGKYQNLALGGAAAVGYGIYEAAKLQTQVVRLYTSAGESPEEPADDPVGHPGDGRADRHRPERPRAGHVLVESAGFHGQNALNVLRSAAQGAYAEGAPIQDVANAATSIMTSYGMYNPSQKQSNAVINQMLQAVGHGKMTMAGLSAALPAVLPVAASAGLSLPQVLGSLATMTAPGMSADWAAQNLGHAITKLQSPTATMTAEMYQLGLDPVKIQQNLGKTGIAGTMNEIQAAIKAHEITSGANKGDIQLPAMNVSKAAQQDALIMMKQMPPAIRDVARAYLDNAISAKQLRTEEQALSPLQGNLLKQFGTVANLAHGYNSALKAGQPAVQAYNAAVLKTLGDSVAMRTYLDLTGQHSAVTAQNIQAVSQAAKDAGQNVEGWGDIQKTFNYQLQSFEYSAEAAATTVGAALLPAATTAMSVLAKGGSFLAGHKTLTMDIALGGGALAALALIKKLSSPITTGLQMVGKVAETLKIPGLDKLANIGKGSASGVMADAAAGNQRAGTTMLEAAGAMQRAADTMVTADAGQRGGLPGGGPGKGKEPVPVAPGEGSTGFLGRLLGSAAARETIPLAISAGIAEAGKHFNPTDYHKQLTSLQKSNKPSESLPVIGPVKSWIDSWALPLLAGLGAAGTGVGRGVSAGPRAPAPPAGVASSGAPSTAFAGRFGPTTAPAPAPAPKPAQPLFSAGAITSATQALTKPVKMAAPDLSALAAAKGKAAQAAEGIHTAAQTPIQKPVKFAPPDLAALAAAKGAAAADGAGLSAGFAAGIEAGKPAAVAAAADVAAAASAAMKTTLNSHSPSKVTHATGADFATGFSQGVTSGTSKAKAAAVSLSASTVTSLTQGLQGGQSAIDAALQAISGKGSRPQDITNIINTISTLKGDVAQALAGGQISKPEDSALVKMLNADNAKLQALSARRTALETEITDAQQIAQSVICGASIMNAGTYVPTLAASNGPVSAYQTIQGMQAQAGDQTAFAQQVKQLAKMGLNSTMLDQLIQGGAQAGLPIAEGLTQGGASAIKQLNATEKQIHAAASSIGNTGGPAMYQAGVQAAQGIAAGLKSQLSAVDAAMSHIAQTMMNALDRALGKGAASKTAAGTAASAAVAAGTTAAAAAAGTAAGGGKAALILAVPSLEKLAAMSTDAARALSLVAADGDKAASALERLASAAGKATPAVSSGGHPGTAYAHPASGGSSGGGGSVHVTVMGSVVSEQDLIAAVLKGLQGHGSDNWQAGLILPGRAA